MECHGCKKEISKNEFKKVGVWDFCTNCFDDLIKKAEEKSSQRQESPKDENSECLTLVGSEVLDAEMADSGKKCTICEMLIKDDDILKIGSLTVCSTCRQELVARPAPVKIKIDVPDEADSLLAEPEDIKTKYQDITSCCECKRPIHRVGGKEFKDKLYCPDCFYKNDFHQSNGQE